MSTESSPDNAEVYFDKKDLYKEKFAKRLSDLNDEMMQEGIPFAAIVISRNSEESASQHIEGSGLQVLASVSPTHGRIVACLQELAN